MSMSNFRNLIERLGLDIRTVCAGGIAVVCALWTLSGQYQNMQSHFQILDSNQTSIESTLTRHDEEWQKTLAENNEQLTEHLKQLQDQNIKAQQELSSRVANLESWRDAEQKRDEQEDMIIARVGEQITSVNASITDMKGMLQGIVMDGYRRDLEARSRQK